MIGIELRLPKHSFSYERGCKMIDIKQGYTHLKLFTAPSVFLPLYSYILSFRSIKYYCYKYLTYLSNTSAQLRSGLRKLATINIVKSAN